MNRMGLGLAVGAGYLLGRTKKLKMAVAVGTMVAGKKLNLTPKGIAELVSTQLQNNPQFKEIGDQLRTDLQGVGKAASGALVERHIDALADRLHGRTAQVRDQLSGAAPAVDTDSDDSRESEGSEDSEAAEGAEDSRHEDEEPRDERDEEPRQERRRERPAKKAPAKRPAKKAAAKAPARKAAAKRAQPAKKAAGKKTAAARGTASRQSKGGGER
ncbi:DNA primase [Streptomyces sp. NPDC032940]|uniref:DNA primase n=1 Tax=Streptomyces sp. NPDC032940 TaxID=3155366 RepID=UPI0033C490D6